MRKYATITPEGTRDLLFEECTIRREVENRLSRVFESCSFSEVVTPSLEFLDVFSLKSHNFPEEQMFKLTDSKGRLVVMRPDSTMPIARLVSTRLKNHTLPIRLYYNQPVFTITPSLSGHSNEVVQMGVEIIGSNTARADLEMIETAVEVLNSSGIGDFRLEIGHIGIFKALVSRLGVGEEIEEQIRGMIEQKNYPALNDLLDGLPADAEEAEKLRMLPRMFGGSEVFDIAENAFGDEQIDRILGYLRRIYTSLGELGLGEKISLDLGIVNRTDYYTGVVLRGYIEGFGETVLSGGRYDSLMGEFGADLPSTGFGVNVDAIARAIQKQREIQPQKAPDILVFAVDGFEMKGLLHGRELIQEGLTVEYCVEQTTEQAMEYAKAIGIAAIDIVSHTVERVAVQ